MNFGFLSEGLYVIAAVLFVLSLRWMSDVRTSRRGNVAGVWGMIFGIVATLLAVKIQHYDLVILAAFIGGVGGAVMALKMPMTAVPQRTAISHAFGALAAALVGTAEYYQHAPTIDTFTLAILSAEMILGYLTFTASLIAFAKLQEIMPGRPFLFPGRRIVSIATFLGAVVFAVLLVMNQAYPPYLLAMGGLSLLFGLLLVLSIGGADMPTVIAILNSFAGLSAAGLGFVLNNKLLIVAGALDGSSGFILALLMCKAMNRSFLHVLFGGFGHASASHGEKGTYQHLKESTAEEAALTLQNAASVIFVPGYGMAVGQAQHAVHHLEKMLEAKGIKVSYAIHPVAGRMPGHMNVLLAEANVAYDKLFDLDQINDSFKDTDVVFVIGANDVVNPAATTQKDSPIYGMPILNVHEARQVFVIKRGHGTGFAGIKNELFEYPQTSMLFGDAKHVLSEIAKQLQEMG